LQLLLQWERFHLHQRDRFQVPSRDPQFDTRYLPQNCEAFELPCYWVPPERLYSYGGGDEITEKLLSRCLPSPRSVLFPIHPTSLDRYTGFLRSAGALDAGENGCRFWAVPTSSTRTLLLWPDGSPRLATFVKTSLFSPILGDRRLHRWKVARSVGLCSLMQYARGRLPASLEFLQESKGLVPRQMPDGGVVFRTLPPGILEGRDVALPLFALLGNNKPSLLLTVMREYGAHAMDAIEDLFCAKFAQLWLHLALGMGIILEAHAQDLMLLVSPDMSPCGQFLYRDFEGLQVDWRLREALGLSSQASMPHACCWQTTYDGAAYPQAQSIWYKWYISLHAYMHFVLHELNSAVQSWQSTGLFPGVPIEPDRLTMRFSKCLFEEISVRFNVSAGSSEYNIYRSMKVFLKLLMGIRNDMLAGRG